MILPRMFLDDFKGWITATYGCEVISYQKHSRGELARCVVGDRFVLIREHNGMPLDPTAQPPRNPAETVEVYCSDTRFSKELEETWGLALSIILTEVEGVIGNDEKPDNA
jgi:hypothetical protein